MDDIIIYYRKYKDINHIQANYDKFHVSHELTNYYINRDIQYIVTISILIILEINAFCVIYEDGAAINILNINKLIHANLD